MLSKKAKYAINSLVRLAKEYDKGPILIDSIAKAEHIPKKFLEVILLDLRNAGILGSRRGPGGGYYLLRKPKDVNMAEVIRLFDGPIALLPCVTYKYYERCEECRDEEICGIRSVIQEVRNETVKILKANTLADILKRERKLLDQKKNA